MQQGDLAKYREALLGVNNIDAAKPTSSTPDMTSTYQHIANAARGAYQAQAAGAAVQSASGAAQEAADQEKANQELAAKQAQDKAKKLQDELTYAQDPKNFQKIINKKTGGFDYYDPLGNPITIQQYAKATNQFASDVLKKSQDPADQAFVSDFNNLLKLGQIMKSGDKDALAKLYKKQPDLKSQIGDMTFAQLTKAFQQHYASYLGANDASPNIGAAGSNNVTPDNRSLASRAIDQLVPSFLGNSNTYDNGYGSAANTYGSTYGG